MATQMWLGTMRTRSPTAKRRVGSGSSMKPCSSFIFVNTDSGASRTRPKLTSDPADGRSEENVFEPPSTIICPCLAVDTTVTKIDAAQSSHAQAPDKTVLRSLDM